MGIQRRYIYFETLLAELRDGSFIRDALRTEQAPSGRSQDRDVICANGMHGGVVSRTTFQKLRSSEMIALDGDRWIATDKLKQN